MSSRLAALARAAPPQAPPDAAAACDMCAAPLPAAHRHLLDLETRALMCACRACALLFDREAAGGGHYTLVPERVRLVSDFDLDDADWDELLIPVDMAFFYRDSRAERTVAMYPGPMGATESQLTLDAWDELEAANPVLRMLHADVEALLVNRARGAREHYLVPLDVCFELVGLMRTRWKGLGGGPELWAALDDFFDELRRRAEPASHTGGGELT